MKKNIFKRTACVLSAAVVCAGACAMFSACTTDHPKVTITYSFNGTDYAVSYTMSRVDAPKTVQHFIELADAGFYDGLCIHDYNENFMYTGGYTLEENELVQKDYFSFVKDAEANGKKFTHTVWAKGADIVPTSPLMAGYTADSDKVPLYTVYGEFTENGAPTENARENVHSYGALVMYYSTKGQDKTNVTTLRNDNGKNNGGDKYDTKTYEWNSATSLFYTYLGTSDVTRDRNYSVFGKVDDAGDAKLRDLIAAIQDFSATLDEDAFAQEMHLTDYDLKKYEPIANVGNGGLSADFKTPVDKPIIVKSVKITKY